MLLRDNDILFNAHPHFNFCDLYTFTCINKINTQKMDGIFYAKLEDDREESGDEQASTDKTEERGGREEVESGSKLNLTVEQEADKSDQDFNYLTSGNTMPVSDSESDGEAPTDIVEEMNRNSLSLRSSDSSSVRSSLGDNRNELSLYQQQFMAPTMNYDRENTSQKLIAVVGREFDRPTEIAVELQRLVPKQLFSESMQAKFIPFTIKRKFLMKGNFESHELQKHDLICMCYNASEARLLLTGTDGFYSALLRQTEVFLGECSLSLYLEPLL